MPITLPTEIVKASTKSPKSLILFSPPKIGKTTLAAGLQNNLIVDLEGGSDFIDGFKVKVKTYQELYELCDEVKKAGKPYRYGTLDTATALEDMIMPLALKLYQGTPMGKAYTGDVLNLPNGAGYKYVRDAYDMMINIFEDSFERIILLGHVKDKLVEKAGKEVNAKELALTGRLSSITCSHVDAIGYLYREGNRCIVTFETSNELVCGARPHHLKNKAFILSEQDPETGVTKTYWDNIFID